MDNHLFRILMPSDIGYQLEHWLLPTDLGAFFGILEVLCGSARDIVLVSFRTNVSIR
jgi:hypothetical protein